MDERKKRRSVEIASTLPVGDAGTQFVDSTSATGATSAPGSTGGPPPPTPAELLTRGQALDDYVILNVIGAGGMGVVYAAYDNKLGRKVAIKVLRAETSVSGEHSLATSEARLLREAQAMAQLSHPNVVTVYQVGTVNGQVYLAMEYIDGQTLTAWLKEKPHRPQEIIDVLVKAGRGLEAAHRAGLVHRDFKPDNILIGRDHQVRVTDFGLARAASDDAFLANSRAASIADLGDTRIRASPPVSVTQTAMLMGTPAYMAAERYLGAPLDARSDQFSYCATLYESLFGQRAFAGATLAEVRGNILTGEMTEPPRTRGVPRQVRALLVRGLSTDPAQRYPSMSELLHVLARKPATQWTILFASLLVLAAGLATLAAFLQSRSEAPRCQGSEKLLDDSWSPRRKEAIHRALTATGLPFAETLWHTVERQLDGYSTSWISMHHDSCEATRRGDQSEATLDRRMICLDRRHRELTALTDTLGRADKIVAENAVKAVGGLSEISDCADLESLMAAIDTPADPVRRKGLDAVHAELDRANVYLAIDPKRGLAMALDTLKRAQELRYPPIEAETRLMIGRMAENAGLFAQAEDNLVRAEQTAEASRADAIKTRARIELVYVVGYELQRYSEAHLWARLAESSMQRGASNELAARALINEGAAYFAAGDYPKSRDLQEKALALQRTLHGNDHPDVATALDHVGNSLLALGDVARALEAQREAVAIFERTLGLEHPAAAEAINNLGNAYAEHEEYANAQVQYKKALALWEKALGPAHPRVAVALSNIGTVELRSGSAASALPYFERALAIEEKAFGPENPSIAATLAHVGTVRSALGTPQQAIATLERALAIWKTAGTTSAEVGQTEFTLAQALWAAGQRQPAVEHAQRGLELLSSAGDDTNEIKEWLAARNATAKEPAAPPAQPKRRAR